MKEILEKIVRSLFKNGKYRLNEKHILRERSYRGISVSSIHQALAHGSLYKVQKPHRVLWGYQEPENNNFLVLSLWLFDENGNFALHWQTTTHLTIESFYVKTAYRKDKS